jgi:predicted RNase H-like nuclease (RuvC/YqgF family)
MSCFAQDRYTFWQQQLEIKIRQLTAANETLEGLLNKEIFSYTLDTTEGEQITRRQKVTDLKKVIELLESEIDQLMRKLAGCGGLVNLNLRRLPC